MKLIELVMRSDILLLFGGFHIFPRININVDQNLRRVDSKGNIYFLCRYNSGYSKTQEELR